MQTIRRCLITGALALVITFTSATTTAAPKKATGIAPPNSTAYGQSLTDWLETYWRWLYSGGDLSQSVINGVQLMPLPAAEQVSGSWSPEDPAVLQGAVTITLKPGTPFVLPLFAWVSERYDPAVTGGQSDDPPFADSVALGSAHPTLTIDGKTVISDANKAAYYVPATAFDPVLTYPEPSSYGSIAGIYFQGVGVVVHPLTPGIHTIHLYEPEIIAPGAYPLFPDGLGIVYDNTWIITVKP